MHRAETRIKEREEHLEMQTKAFEAKQKQPQNINKIQNIDQSFSLKTITTTQNLKSNGVQPLNHCSAGRRTSLGGVKGMDIDDVECSDSNPTSTANTVRTSVTHRSKPIEGMSFKVFEDVPSDNTTSTTDATGRTTAVSSSSRLKRPAHVVSGVKRGKDLLEGCDEHDYGNANNGKNGTTTIDKENQTATVGNAHPSGPIFGRFKPTPGALHPHPQTVFIQQANMNNANIQSKMGGSPFKKLRPALGLVHPTTVAAASNTTAGIDGPAVKAPTGTSNTSNREALTQEVKSQYRPSGISCLVKRAAEAMNPSSNSSKTSGPQIMGTVRNSINAANGGNRILRR